jgi:hypothetical protein
VNIDLSLQKFGLVKLNFNIIWMTRFSSINE